MNWKIQKTARQGSDRGMEISPRDHHPRLLCGWVVTPMRAPACVMLRANNAHESFVTLGSGFLVVTPPRITFLSAAVLLSIS